MGASQILASLESSAFLAWEIQEEVEAQVKVLTGLNQEAKGLYRDENVFEDADHVFDR